MFGLFEDHPPYLQYLKSDGDVSPVNDTTILGVIVYVGQILSWLITSPLAIQVK